MNVNVNDLLSERAQLLKRLEEIESALKTFQGGAAEAVGIRTHKNIRNTAWLETDPDRVKEYGGVLVYEDEELTTPADESAHEGYISGADAAWIKTNRNKVGDVTLEE